MLQGSLNLPEYNSRTINVSQKAVATLQNTQSTLDKTRGKVENDPLQDLSQVVIEAKQLKN